MFQNLDKLLDDFPIPVDRKEHLTEERREDQLKKLSFWSESTLIKNTTSNKINNPHFESNPIEIQCFWISHNLLQTHICIFGLILTYGSNTTDVSGKLTATGSSLQWFSNCPIPFFCNEISAAPWLLWNTFWFFKDFKQTQECPLPPAYFAPANSSYDGF